VHQESIRWIHPDEPIPFVQIDGSVGFSNAGVKVNKRQTCSPYVLWRENTHLRQRSSRGE
jgi:hypothetical protein